MAARDDGVVEFSDAIAGEEEDALVIFDLSEEDFRTNKAI